MRIFFRNILWITLIIVSTSCSRDTNKTLQGYIEGEYIYVTTTVPGKLISLDVRRGQQVKRGDLLFRLDPQPESHIVASAEATIAQFKAELEFNEVELDRQKKLYLKNATDKSSLDQASRDFDSKTEQLEGAIAINKEMQWNLEQKTSLAPIESVVVDTFFRIGENVGLNQPVLSLLAPHYIHVLFYVPETMLSQIRVGQTISFTCDSCKKSTNAIISYISPDAEYTPPIIYSVDTRYKLVFLVRADMPNDIAKQFHPGQPVDVLLHE